VGREKVWSLTFADDVVTVAKIEREMKEMMRSQGKYVRKKKLEVNVETTKMMEFKKRKRKSEENELKWKGRIIERVSEFKYLGYTFNERATDKAHIRDIVRKEEGKQGSGMCVGNTTRGMGIPVKEDGCM
jgi:hypothetical protein